VESTVPWIDAGTYLDLWAVDSKLGLWNKIPDAGWNLRESLGTQLPKLVCNGAVELGDAGDPEIWVVGGLQNPDFDPCRVSGNLCPKVPLGDGGNLYAISSSTAVGTWAVGFGGLVMQIVSPPINGTQVLPPPTTNSLNGVWVGPTMVYTVGDFGTACTGQSTSGNSWSCTTIASQRLNGVWGDSANTVWTVGDQGTLLHFVGTLWNSIPSGTPNGLHAVTVSGSGEIWLVGDLGTILRHP
jgi:hypothetical protein